MKICSVENCGRKHGAKGFCSKHYSNFLYTGNPLGKFNGDKKALSEAIRKRNTKYIGCKIEDCNKKHFSKGYCHVHYENFRSTGNPLGKRHKCIVENCNNSTTNPKFCHTHSQRNKLHRSLDLSIKYTLKGRRNFMWKGGVAEYPNHYLMKKNRLIILIHNPICEICHKKPATEVHHKDGDKSNHELSNLVASCHKCNSSIRFGPNHTKNYLKYGMSLYQIAQKINHSYIQIYNREKQGILESIIASNPNIFALDK